MTQRNNQFAPLRGLTVAAVQHLVPTNDPPCGFTGAVGDGAG